MKTNLTRKLLGTTGLVMVLFTIGLAVSSAQSGSRLGGGRVEGTWNVRVTIRNCETGAEIRSFDSVGTIMAGGTTIDSTSGIPQALRTPGQGIWAHVGGNTYRFKFKSFSFDPAGNFTGWTIIQHQASLNHTADAYISAGTAQIYAPNGTLISTGCLRRWQRDFCLIDHENYMDPERSRDDGFSCSPDSAKSPKRGRPHFLLRHGPLRSQCYDFANHQMNNSGDTLKNFTRVRTLGQHLRLSRDLK